MTGNHAEHRLTRETYWNELCNAAALSGHADTIPSALFGLI